MLKCVECDNEIRDHKWAKIKAQSDGWYFAWNGDVYCPLHIPDWVKNWRENKR